MKSDSIPSITGGVATEGSKILIDPSGRVVPVLDGEVQSALGIGFAPASPAQISDFNVNQKLHEKTGVNETELERSSVDDTLSKANALGMSMRSSQAVGFPVGQNAISDIVSKAVTKGAGSAIKALYAGDSLVSEKALGDPNITAESITSRVSIDDLLGRSKEAWNAAPASISSANPKSIATAATRTGSLIDLANRTASDITKERQSSELTGKGHDSTVTPMSSSPSKIAVLSEFEKQNQEIQDKIDTLAGNLVRGSAHGQTVGRGEALPGVGSVLAKEEGPALAAYQRRVQNVQLLANNPQGAMDLLGRQTEGWSEHAPDTAAAVNAVTMRAVSFLSERIPDEPMPGPLAMDYEPSKSDLAIFNRYYDALNNPLGILKQATNGSLTTEAVEAVKSVYPALYSRMQQSIIEQLVDKPKPSYTQRIMIGALLGQDLDGSLSGSMMAANKNAYTPVQPQAGAKTPTSKNTLGHRTLTDSQAAADRREGEG